MLFIRRYFLITNLLIFTLLHTQVGMAMEVNIATLMANLSSTVPQLMQLVTALAYVLGMSFVIKSILEFKKYGDQKTQMSNTAELKGPLIFLLVGGALLYLPSAVHVGMSTFWSNPSPYGYVNESNDAWGDMINDIFGIIQLIGTIAFIKGLVVLTQMGGHHGSQPGTFGKAMAHIIGGVFCININQFVQVVLGTLALGQ